MKKKLLIRQKFIGVFILSLCAFIVTAFRGNAEIAAIMAPAGLGLLCAKRIYVM